MINIPMTLFNFGIALPSNWFGFPFFMQVGLILQLVATVFLLTGSMRDPGIIPATFISPQAKRTIDRKYQQIIAKEDRIFY